MKKEKMVNCNCNLRYCWTTLEDAKTCAFKKCNQKYKIEEAKKGAEKK
jgi:hypothetical protein